MRASVVNPAACAAAGGIRPVEGGGGGGVGEAAGTIWTDKSVLALAPYARTVANSDAPKNTCFNILRFH